MAAASKAAIEAGVQAGTETSNGSAIAGAIARILDGEAQDTAGIYRRFCTVLDLLDAAQSDGELMAWLYALLRLHYTKQLRWYGRFNYQSKDIAHLQDTLSRRMSLAACYAPEARARRLARMAMAFLSRGGGMSEQIRLQILDMMRRHGIREGHRPGIEDRFLEQWHQKLHQSSTPEDITICEAYLGFLRTGREGDFWHALWSNGGISRDRLASMPNPITASPRHLPQLIPDLERYLWTLKTVHAGADLGFMIASGKWALEQAGDHEAVGWLYQICNDFGAWWIPGKIAQARERLRWPMRNVFAAERDLLLLDAALDTAFKTAVERIDLSKQSGDGLVDVLDLVLAQAMLGANDDPEHAVCLEQWRKHVKDGARWSPPWALRALAAADRIALLLQHETRALSDLLQPKAEAIARAAGIPEGHLADFGEAVIRGQSSYALSPLLQRLRPMLRTSAGVGAWNVVSAPAQGQPAVGTLVFAAGLAQARLPPAEQTAVLVVDRVEGNDDPPANVSAVLTAGSLDVLSHVAIRARNQGLLLACCDEERLAQLRRSHPQGTLVAIRVRRNSLDGDLVIEQATASPTSRPAQPRPARLVERAPWRGPLLAPDGFAPGRVGAKAQNLARLSAALPDGLTTPPSLALPFGTLEATLALAANASVAERVQSLAGLAHDHLAGGDARAMSAALHQLRRTLASDLVADSALEAALREILLAFAQPVAALPRLWQGVRAVWASTWSERAFLARARVGIRDAELCMSVLVQPLVPADYAFVLHTGDPLTRARDAVWGEVVVGLGESLVGNHPGRAFAFTASRASAGRARVLAYPSKPKALFVERSSPGLMVRSDCNGEDLVELAGAGLYDSVACATVAERTVDYTACALVADEGFQRNIMDRLHEAGIEVERAMGGVPQDIEGVICDGRVTIVQARPQVTSNNPGDVRFS